MKASEMLRKWLTDHGIPQCAFARSVEVDRSTVTLWLKGARCPWKKHAIKIQNATGGAIDAKLWQA